MVGWASNIKHSVFAAAQTCPIQPSSWMPWNNCQKKTQKKRNCVPPPCLNPGILLICNPGHSASTSPPPPSSTTSSIPNSENTQANSQRLAKLLRRELLPRDGQKTLHQEPLADDVERRWGAGGGWRLTGMGTQRWECGKSMLPTSLDFSWPSAGLATSANFQKNVVAMGVKMSRCLGQGGGR